MMDYIKGIIKKIGRNKPVSFENIIGMFCMCVAGYCGVLRKEKELIRYTGEMIREKEAQIYREYSVLEKYTKDADVLGEFISVLDIKNITNALWWQMGECLISLALNDKVLSDVKMRPFIARLCLALLNPETGTFYDGAAGIGEVVLAAESYSNKLQIFAQESNEVYYAISVLRAYMKKSDNIQLRHGDALKNPAFTDGRELKKFDYGVIFPPYGISARKIENEMYPDSYSKYIPRVPPATPCEWLYIKHLCNCLTDGGRGIAIVPAGALFNSVAEYVREKIIGEGLIECVISLPQNVLLNSTIPLNLIIFSKEKHSKIFFVRGESWFEQYKTDYKNPSDMVISNIAGCFREKTEIAGVSRYVSLSELENSILLPSRYVEKPISNHEFGKLLICEPSGDEWGVLKDTGSMYRGINLSVSTKGSSFGEYKVINYTDIQNGELMCDTVKFYHINYGAKIEKYKVKKGDIIISCKGTSIKICAIPEINETMLLSANFIGIRIDSERYDPVFLKYFLESPAGKQFLQRRQVGTSIFTLAVRDLEQIPVPKISLATQKEYVNELMEKEKEICDKINQLKSQLSSTKWDFYSKIGLDDVMKSLE